ncbi:hypothetical protein [Synechococcus sp. NOUM97013]|uniref:hypothetical protein n=1 Tax=Synechococcus sp. NOUM97013 TaxID=1442555 RepID=UPI0016489241|nr:hypothetical protein [Synechococcus sp. NOUM97013]
MKSLVKSSLGPNYVHHLAFFPVDLSSHFLYDCFKFPISFYLNAPKEYDICYVGSFSSPHSVHGFICLIDVLPFSSQILISESVFNELRQLHPFVRQSLNCYKFNEHYFTVLPYLSPSSYKSEVLKSKIGFVSLKSNYTGVCYPSRVFTYLELGIPVFFDGNKESIDSLLSRNEMGIEVDVLNTPPEQLAECLHLLFSNPDYPINALNYISGASSKSPLPLFN